MGMIGNAPAAGVIGGGNILDGTIDTVDLKDGAVTAAKLASTAVTDKLGYTPMQTIDYNASTINLNSIVTAGTYRLGAAGQLTNLPSGVNGYGNLLVMRQSGQDTITQIYGAYDSAELYTRSGNPSNVGGTGVWSSWRKVVTSDTSDNLIAANLTGAKMTVSGNVFGVGGGAVRQWSGATSLATGFSVDIAFPSNECSGLLICNHWHWGNGGYGAGRMSNVSVGPNGSIIDSNIQNLSTANGGSFSFSKVNDSTIRVTKNAGSYDANCRWHITCIGN